MVLWSSSSLVLSCIIVAEWQRGLYVIMGQSILLQRILFWAIAASNLEKMRKLAIVTLQIYHFDLTIVFTLTMFIYCAYPSIIMSSMMSLTTMQQRFSPNAMSRFFQHIFTKFAPLTQYNNNHLSPLYSIEINNTTTITTKQSAAPFNTGWTNPPYTSSPDGHSSSSSSQLSSSESTSSKDTSS